jgi:hypothetical protein
VRASRRRTGPVARGQAVECRFVDDVREWFFDHEQFARDALAAAERA